MFTGIISSIGTIISSKQAGDLAVAISCDWPDDAIKIGESIACDGACLTVTSWRNQAFSAQLSGETLSRTSPRWGMGEKINLERALKMGDALDGHLVTGHIDGTAKILSVTLEGDSHILELEAPAELARFIAEKGSVTLNGVSLTVNNVAGARFFVNIIPHTWDVTNLHLRSAGDLLNLEVDLIARYTARLLDKS